MFGFQLILLILICSLISVFNKCINDFFFVNKLTKHEIKKEEKTSKQTMFLSRYVVGAQQYLMFFFFVIQHIFGCEWK